MVCKRKKEEVKMNKGSSSIHPTNILAGAIAVYENAWKDYDKTINDALSIDLDPLVNEKFLPSQTTQDSDNGNRFTQSIRTSSGLSIGRSALSSKIAKDMYDSCDKLICSAVSEYVKIFKIYQEIKTAEGYSLLRYKPGEKYNLHYDGGTETSRAISVLIYLNDDYVGGEIEFPNFDIKIKPKAGTLVLFPSNYAYSHIAHEVVSGTKYVIVTWLKDR
jgi:Rps23 Pro-64 3,4-dihydroxylase Tpa1-like proline 4-hydroxylase